MYPVAPAQRSPAALAKAATKATPGGGPVHSFATLLADLATIAASHIQPAGGLPPFTQITTPAPSSATPSNSSASRTASATRWSTRTWSPGSRRTAISRTGPSATSGSTRWMTSPRQTSRSSRPSWPLRAPSQHLIPRKATRPAQTPAAHGDPA
jgi:hypothetical protein